MTDPQIDAYMSRIAKAMQEEANLIFKMREARIKEQEQRKQSRLADDTQNEILAAPAEQ